MGEHRVTRSVNGDWLVLNPAGTAISTHVTQRAAWRQADRLNGEAISVGEDWSHYVAKAR